LSSALAPVTAGTTGTRPGGLTLIPTYS
jgi:hypothetical protein